MPGASGSSGPGSGGCDAANRHARLPLWVVDITYILTWAGFLFLAVVLDAYSRRIVGWAMATTLKTDLVLDALNMAFGQRKPHGVIHHSDKGSSPSGTAARRWACGPRAGRWAMPTTTPWRKASSRPSNVNSWPGVASHPGRGPGRRLPLHQRLVQSAPPTLRPRPTVPDQL
jgi:hypothetical protein